MSRRPIITLLSDFGLRDPYAAEMKAVILSICPDAAIVDVSHEITKFDIRMGAFILAQAAPYFPEGTIHVAVVDPGVGTKRRPIIIETRKSFYIGPDNGLLMLSAQREGITHVYKISNPKYTLSNISMTFHGRDIFSSAAAHLANGAPPSDFGPEITDPVTPIFAKPAVENGEVRGEIIHVDDFGNLITNITADDLKDVDFRKRENLVLLLKDGDLTLRLCIAYGEAPPNTPLAIVGSSGFLEVAVNQGDASRILCIGAGDRIILRPSRPVRRDEDRY